VGTPRLAHNAVYKIIPCVAIPLNIFCMQPPSKLFAKNYSQIFKFSDTSKCSLPSRTETSGFSCFLEKIIISDLFADNERPRSPNQFISLVKNVCQQSLPYPPVNVLRKYLFFPIYYVAVIDILIDIEKN
jgi:hypothetical protein